MATTDAPDTKERPFCVETIKTAAIKCRFCGEVEKDMLDAGRTFERIGELWPDMTVEQRHAVSRTC